MNTTPTPTGQVIAFLNDLLKTDEYALRRLITTTALCSNDLAEHPDVEVWRVSDATSERHQRLVLWQGDGPPTDGYCVGLLGILNGLVRCFDPGVSIAAEMDRETGAVRRFFAFDRHGTALLSRPWPSDKTA